MNDKVFVDTNVFLYAFSNKDLHKQAIAKRHILEDSTISVQIINETSNNLIKKLSFNEEEVQAFIQSCYARYEVVSITQEIFLSASNVRSRYGYSYYDSLVIAAALLTDCSILLSEDMHDGQVINAQLTIVNPFK